MQALGIQQADRWPALEEFFDIDTFETIAETTSAYVTCAQLHQPSQVTVVIKSGAVDPYLSKQPHDIGKELRILLNVSHVNIINVLGHTYEAPTSTLHFWMPLVPIHLSDILISPFLSPLNPPALPGGPTNPASFSVITKSLIFQILSALAYIHECKIAHRDVKPRNILIAHDGCVKLVDFGVSWSEQPDDRDLWPEPPGKMCFDVATGPYRAPELLFGTRDYDAYAVDLWSMGVVLSEFFTPLRLQNPYGGDDEDWGDVEDSEEGAEQSTAKPPLIIPKGLSPDQPDVEWTRDSLYDSSRGQIGLAWSIFKVHGTPTTETWPTFKDLPDAQKVTFVQVPAINLSTLLPNLPATEQGPERGDCLDLVKRLLVYPPDQRLKAAAARNHYLFTRGVPLLLPPGYPNAVDQAVRTWEGRELADVLSQYLRNA